MRVRVQNMEQLHARDPYQNVTEHKPQATVYETKSINICTTQNLGRASYSNRHVMPGPYDCCMHTGLAHHVLCRTCLLRWHSCCL